MEPKPKERIVFDEDLYYGDEGEEMAINDLKETCKEAFGILPGADDGGYSLSGEAKEAALSRFALPENRKAALNVIRKLNESRDSNDNAL